MEYGYVELYRFQIGELVNKADIEEATRNGKTQGNVSNLDFGVRLL